MKTSTRQKPQLSFSANNDSWRTVLLDSLTERGTGHTPSKSHPEYYQGDIPWVSLADSDKLDKGLIKSTRYTISDSGIRNSSAVLHPKGTVLLSRDAGIGKSAIMGVEMAVSQHFITWRCSDELNNVFLYYYLQKQKREFERISVGSTIKTIGLPYFRKFKITLPSRVEQDKIADFIGSVDLWLNNLRSQKTALENYKRGMMQKLFTQEVRFKDDKGKDFPVWQEDKLGNLFSVIAGKTKSQYIDDNGRYIIVDMGGISTDGGLIATKRTNNDVGFLAEGDLVMPKDDIGGGQIIGRVAYIPRSDKFICGDHVYKLSLKVKGQSKFFYYIINSYKVNKEFRKKANGTAQLGLSKDSVLSQPLSFPTHEEQQKIADFLTAIDETITAKTVEITKVELWKKGLMQKMFV